MSAQQSTTTAPGIVRRFWLWLPDKVDRRVIAAAWATLVVQIGSVGPNAVGFVDPLVVKKTTYFYRVRAANGSARSAYTNPASVRVK